MLWGMHRWMCIVGISTWPVVVCRRGRMGFVSIVRIMMMGVRRAAMVVAMASVSRLGFCTVLVVVVMNLELGLASC